MLLTNNITNIKEILLKIKGFHWIVKLFFD